MIKHKKKTRPDLTSTGDWLPFRKLFKRRVYVANGASMGPESPTKCRDIYSSNTIKI